MTSRISILLIGLFALPVLAERAGPEGRRRGPRGPRDLTAYVHKVAEAVDATEAQIVQLEAIAAEQKAADCPSLTEEQTEALQSLRDQVRAARKAGNDEQVDALRTQLRELRGPNPMQEAQDKIRAILMPEQLEAFDELVNKDRGRRRGGQRGRADGRSPRAGGMNIDRLVKRVIAEVDATEEQQEQLKAISAEHRAALKTVRKEQAEVREANREELEDLHRQVRTARSADDKDAVKDLREEICDLMGGSARDLNEDTQAKIAGVLTAEQLPKYEALLDEVRDQSRGHRAGKHRGKGAGKGKGGGKHGKRGRRHGQDNDPSGT